MADNTTLNIGSGGDVIRTDDIAGVKIPTSKIILGADGVDEGFLTLAQLVTPLGRLDIALSVLRDAIIGAGPKTLSDLDARLATLAGYQDGVETLLTAIDGHVDGAETLLAALATLLAGGLPLALGSSGGLKVEAQAGEAFAGSVGGITDIVSVTLSLDTSAYTSGDVLADTQVVTNAARKTDGTGTIQSLVVIDKDDNGVAMDLHFFSANVALGTENSPPSISDANTDNHLGSVSVAAAEYKDLGGVKVATVRGVALPFKAASGTRHIYVSAVTTGGSPTHTATGITLRVGVLQD